jgi:hypothetical protein
MSTPSFFEYLSIADFKLMADAIDHYCIHLATKLKTLKDIQFEYSPGSQRLNSNILSLNVFSNILHEYTDSEQIKK